MVSRPSVGINYFKYSISTVLRGLRASDTRIVIFVSETNHTIQRDIGRHLHRFHQHFLDRNIINICTVNPDVYPEPRTVEKFTNEGFQRQKWRIRQSLDYATLFHIVRDDSEYYLHLEDDVICEKDYLLDIRKFIVEQGGSWTLLEFSEQGFIGKLLHGSSLDHLARYIWMFRKEAPVDWLLMRFRGIQKDRRIYRGRILFHHIGLYSSLVGQIRKDAYRISRNTAGKNSTSWVG